MRLSYFAPAAIAGVIRLSRRPSALGTYIDTDGKRWDVAAIIGENVCACPASELHPYFADTSGMSFGFVSQTWKPYRVEIVP